MVDNVDTLTRSCIHAYSIHALTGHAVENPEQNRSSQIAPLIIPSLLLHTRTLLDLLLRELFFCIRDKIRDKIRERLRAQHVTVTICYRDLSTVCIPFFVSKIKIKP
jgi:hypothetical protein